MEPLFTDRLAAVLTDLRTVLVLLLLLWLPWLAIVVVGILLFVPAVRLLAADTPESHEHTERS